jgi:hypothetical protein
LKVLSTAGIRATRSNLHLTVSPEHEEEFSRLFQRVKKKYEAAAKCEFQMSFSHQKNVN